MNKRFAKIVCLLLSAVLILTTSNHAKATTTETKEQIIHYADLGVTITILENKNLRTTILTDHIENTQTTLVFNKETGVLKNTDSGAELALFEEVQNWFSPCKILNNRTEYEYEFCQLGQIRYVQYDMLLSEFVAMIAATITAVSIVTLVVSIAGVGLAGSAFTNANNLGNVIVNMIANAEVLTHYRIHMTFSESCAEFWESDPYYPGGGFWFLGYSANPNFFNWYIY